MLFQSWGQAVELYATAGRLKRFPTRVRESIAQQAYSLGIEVANVASIEDWLREGRSVKLSEIYRFVSAATESQKAFVFLTENFEKVVSTHSVLGGELIGVTDIGGPLKTERLYDISQTFTRQENTSGIKAHVPVERVLSKMTRFINQSSGPTFRQWLPPSGSADCC